MVIDLDGQRRITIRQAIADSFCASSTTTCPNATALLAVAPVSPIITAASVSKALRRRSTGGGSTSMEFSRH